MPCCAVSCRVGGEAAPLPPAANALLDKGGYPLLPRLWAKGLGTRTPKSQTELRERVRRAAIQFVYEEELAVSLLAEHCTAGCTVRTAQGVSVAVVSCCHQHNTFC